ncbi:MAG TPA: UvrD-helicase domain-containing protein [Actinophytocola sp.]|uniref:UvrD-helicase domain-containing protein n=1 Tax=Actinophytocola sp. TaxID=1872138 RepID=UPI002DDD6459|nr:UvrD-helicase domain-containing protein [Actinophytocola sp.]HEV2779636.1 UvrD-helicase domain-containing protein [Actinophytocola sp.]
MPARRSAPEHEPTPQQRAAVTEFCAGHHLVLQAGAGSGKTTTLAMLAAGTRRWGRYLAFNSAIAREARGAFGSNVDCRTAHSLAYRAVGWRYEDRLKAPRMSSAKLAAMLGINLELRLGQRRITASGLAYAAQETVIRYCQSADAVIGPQHVPWLRGIGEEYLHDQLAEVVLPYAERMWVDLQNPERGRVRFRHDHYLKMWALTEPVITGKFLLLDEAQDTNPVVEQVFNAQRGHAQLVMVGDSGQAIYGWRGARDVMTGFDGVQLTLSHSFRFGEGIAVEANRWLAIAGAPIRITGSPSLDSGLDKVERPDAILCRTNGGAMAEILTLLSMGRRVALVGRGDTLSELALAARDLKSGRRTSHPELLLFATWGEVQDYAENDPDGRELQPFVDVIDEHGVDVVLDVISRLCDEAGAEVTVSTVHKAKGREWPTVRIANDFHEPEDPDQEVDATGEPLPGPIDPAEARLAYVAVTRARDRLDLGGLSWINRHPDGKPEQPAGP